MSDEGDIRELQVKVEYIGRDVKDLLEFKESTSGLIVEYTAMEQRRETRGARLLRIVTIAGGLIGILSAIGVILGPGI